MRYSFENNNQSMEQSSEVNENTITSEQLSEAEETSENFDDCSIDEFQDSRGNEVNAESLEEAEENYDDCEAKMEKMEEKNPELAEENDDFDDCGKETDGQYVAEVTYTTDGEISQEEAGAELQESYNECGDPENMQQLKENANENEHIEVHNAEVIERPESNEVADEVTEEEYEQAQEELEEAEETLEVQQEAAQEYNDDLENQINKNENEIPEGTENIDNDASEDVEENQEELVETEEGNAEDENSNVDEMAEDDTEQLEDTEETGAFEVEENIEDAESDSEQVEEQSENIDENAETSDENDENVDEGTSSEEEENTEDAESDSEQVEEQSESIDENAETSDENDEDVDEDTSSEVVESDDLEQMDDDTKVEVSKINEESVSEDVSQNVEEQTETELSDETKEKIREDIAENIDGEAEEGKISSEKAEEIINENVEENVDNIEEQQEMTDDIIDDRAEEIVDNEDLTNDEMNEQISDEVKESTGENLSDEKAEAIAEEKSDEIENAIEEKKEEQEAVEAIEETSEELENDHIEQESEEESKSLRERIDGAFEKDDVSSSEINDLREENTAELQAKVEERTSTESELKSKFDEVLSKEKGSEEYKQSLREYNDLRDQKASLDEQIATMEKQQELLDKKSLELRDAQIQKGTEAVAASAVTLAGVSELQERYDQTYYDTRPDKGELANIREESCSTIKELSAEKDSIKQAMDAKMDEISEYVTSNNMERYDTAHDLRYQQLSAEYNAMKESYDRIGYSIVKLDENNKAITEQLGDKYVSMAELPPASRISEVNNGSDVPGETNYFIDEAKAAEVLSPFKQGNWEQLSVKEQKQAVEKLANYNAEILGVEDKPRIVYYNTEDPCDFGGYSAKQNAIYINEYNMYDAAETADTISHEYRHKYQHERADKLETERDLEFKEGFDNYIRAEDDYQGYKEQLVESDARDYAQVVRDKIASYSETPNEIKTSFTEQGSQGTEFSELNPEKGAVFEKVSVDELPEDFEQKDRIAYKEVLETQELDELRSVAGVHYENGEAVWSKLGIQELESYKEHNDIESGHIEKVRLKSLEAADTLEAHFSKNDYDGLYSPNIDRRTVEVMSIYHDTGMDGNIKVEDYEAEREAYISNEQIREKYVSAAVAKKEKEAAKAGEPFDRVAAEAKANEKFEKEGFENHFRPNHSLESAIHALRDRESISNLNVNADEVALGCLVHSKSNSGLRNIASEDDWRTAVRRLQERVNEYNESHPDEQIYFDRSFLVNEDGSFNQDKLAEMRSEAIVLRIGDANGHDTNSRTSQTGKSIEFNLEQKAVSDELPSDFESKFEKGEYDEFFLEVQSADVKVDGTELNNTNDPKGISRMFAVGEGNFQSLNCEVGENGVIKQNFELCDGNAFPLSTQHCIEERLGEYKTAHPMKYTPVVKLGSNCSDEVYQSYLAFADKIERDYNVRMEVER